MTRPTSTGPRLAAAARSTLKHAVLGAAAAVDRWLGRRRRIRVLFLISNPIGYACLKPVFEALREHPRFSVRIAEDIPGALAVVPDAAVSRVATHRVPASQARWLPWDVIVATEVVQTFFPFQPIVAMLAHGAGHGTMDRRSAVAPRANVDYFVGLCRSPQVNLCCLNGVSRLRRIEEEAPQLLGDPTKAFVITGFPKLDALWRQTRADRDHHLRQLGLDPARSTVVVTSHYTERSLLRTFGRDLIATLLASGDDVNILVTGHDRLWTDRLPAWPGGEPGGLADQLRALEQERPNLRFAIHVPDPVSILGAGDVFLCDNSSIFIDCCVLDRPILFFAHPDRMFHAEDVERLYRAASTVFSDLNGLPQLIRRALAAPAQQTAERAALVEFFLDRPGEATSRVVRTIERLATAGSGPGDRWREFRVAAHRALEQHGYKVDSGGGLRSARERDS